MQEIMDAPEVESVGIVASDFEGLKPTLLVKVGDRVQLGQPVFQDKKNPGNGMNVMVGIDMAGGNAQAG